MSFESDFTSALHAAGYEPLRPIRSNTSGTWGRLRYDGEKKSSGRYRLTIEGDKAYGVFGSDKDPLGFHTFRSWEGQEIDNKKRKELQDWQKKQDAIRKEKEEKRQKRLSKNLSKIYNRLPDPPDDHPYAVKKEITLEKIKYRPKTGALILPIMQAEDNKPWSLQQITKQGGKYFFPGGKVKGGFCPLTTAKEDKSVIIICEGYSTGRSIRQATGLPVMVAFNANNLKPVAEIVRNRHVDAVIVIAADNDEMPPPDWPENKKWTNTGLKKGQQAAAAVGGVCACPRFEANDSKNRWTDFNDYAKIYGNKELDKFVRSSYQSLSVGTPLEPPPTSPPVQANRTPEGAHFSDFGTSPIKYTENNWFKHVRWKDGREGFYDKNFSLHNAILHLSFFEAWKNTFVYDEFAGENRIIRGLPWDNEAFRWRNIRETDLTQVRAHLAKHNINIGSNSEMRNVLESVALNKKIHPVREYFDNLEWDGEHRLGKWLQVYCGATAQPEEYLSAIGSCWLKGAVKRIYEPGTKFDHMLVLEGDQGAGKSRALKALATFNGMSYFGDAVGFEDIGSKHVAAFLQGKLIMEFAELTGLTVKDRNKIKSWITQTVDEVQPKFKNEIVEYPRQFVLAGSTNDSTWMNDPTGGRRFWPVQVVGAIDVEGLEIVVEQLWAEAVYRVKSGEAHYIVDNDPVYKYAKAEQAARFQSHVWEDVISEYLMGKNEVAVDDILKNALFMDRDRWNNRHKADIGDVLRGLGWSYKNVRDKNTKKQRKIWVKDD